MADSIDVSIDGLDELIRDMGKVSGKALPLVAAIIEKAAIGIKKDLTGQATYSPHFKGLAGSISYDSDYRLGQVAFEIGPDKDKRGGALGNLFFFGGANGGGGTGDLDGALRTEEPYMMKALDDYLGGLL